jgi:hypothetical protein
MVTRPATVRAMIARTSRRCSRIARLMGPPDWAGRCWPAAR